MGDSIDKDLHHGRTGGMEARKYLREGCCHCIECSAANFLTVFIWRRPLNSATLATTTHRKPKKVFNGTVTQVRAQMTNKWMIKMI